MTMPSQAIGYIRVSTEMQNEGDHALGRQAERIRNACAARGMPLGGIYEDTASATDAFSVERRPSLQDAVSRARRENACLVVTEPTRLFRNVEVAERWLQNAGVEIFSVRDGMILSRSQILEAVKRGEDLAKASSAGTVKALSKKRAAGVTLGSKADRTAANRASKLARAQRSDTTVDTLARVLSEDLAYRDLSHGAFADLLNRRNILTGWGRPWTAAGVRRQRAIAEQRLEEWAQIEADDSPGELVVAPIPEPVAEPVDEYSEMRKLPTFGMF
jgi:DNA invertase Pin-like site-specific DNA recombinase